MPSPCPSRPRPAPPAAVLAGVLALAAAGTRAAAAAAANKPDPAAVAATRASEAGWDPATNYPSLSPAESIRTIEVPPGHRLQCVASEPMVQDPVMMAFDGDGALYVCEWRTYMQDEHGSRQLAPEGRVVKLEDTDGDGVMDKRTVFIDGAILPRAVLPLHDRVLVYFTESSTVYAYFDDDHDGVADRREVAWQGAEDHGNIEHQQSGFLWNLDNTLCTNDRRLRWNGGRLESLAHDRGRIAQFGLAHDDDGRLVCSWGGGANPAHSFQLPAGYPILDLPEHGPGYERTWGICPVWDQSDGGYDRERRAVLTRFSATCGQTVLRSHRMPAWQGNAVTCEPVGRLIRMSRFEWKDGVGTAHNAFPGSEFIRATDPYFRPVWTENGPDGGLYIADMHRGIIQEKEWFPTEVTDALQEHYTEDYRKNKLAMWVDRYHRVKRWGMLAVVRHGRIYRLLPDAPAPAEPRPRMLRETPAQLVAHLAHPGGWWRDTAHALLVSRGDTSAVPALVAMASAHASPDARIHALWVLEGLSSLPPGLVRAGLSDPHPRVRRAAVQLAEPRVVRGERAFVEAVGAMASDPDAQVATQVFLAFRASEAAGGPAVPAVFRAPPRPLPLVAKIAERDRARAQQRLSDAGRAGKAVYESLCIACHGADGQGVASNDRFLAPPLAKSPWFADGGHVPVLARIVLKGQAGPIDGVEYGVAKGEGVMVPLETTHSDADLAAVLTYIGEAWHGWSRAVGAREIASVRAEIAARHDPWSHEELVAWDQARRKNFHPVPLGTAATADGRTGVYLAADVPGDRVSLRRHGMVAVDGVPFSLPDPASLEGGRNVVVLRGGVAANAVSRSFPASVDVAVGRPAARIHLLGGVAGWGWPAVPAMEPVLTLVVHYAGGTEERIVLANGVDIADHAGPVDVPGSARTSLVSRGQLRYLWRDLAQPGRVVERITLAGAGGGPAPMVAAITVEAPGADGRVAPPPLAGGRAPAAP